MLLLLPVSLVYSGVEYIQYILLSYSVVALPATGQDTGYVLGSFHERICYTSSVVLVDRCGIMIHSIYSLTAAYVVAVVVVMVVAILHSLRMYIYVCSLGCIVVILLHSILGCIASKTHSTSLLPHTHPWDTCGVVIRCSVS